MSSRLVASCAALAIMGVAAAAHPQDQPTLSGTWTASALGESWRIGDWGAACGPRPSPNGAPGGTVQIKDQGGELSIAGAGRRFSTTECWEQMPGMSRTSHSGGARSWRTRCATPKNDPRQATVVTSIRATDTNISFTETGQYQFVIHDQNCTASVTRSRSFALQQRDGDVPAPASPPPTALPTAAPAATEAKALPTAANPTHAKCTGAGDPARLEVYPAKKLLHAGDAFAFRAVVRDASGCALTTRPAWSIDSKSAVAESASVDADGKVSVRSDASEGTFTLRVAVGEHGVSIPVEVASTDRYDALLAANYESGGGAEQPAVAVLAVGTIGGRAVTADDTSKQRKVAFVAIVACVSACLALFALALHRRGRHAERAAEASREGHEGAATSAEPPDVTPAVPPPTGKICPTCGDHYPAQAVYCGRDATQLVPLN